jgi:hypothetical protein
MARTLMLEVSFSLGRNLSDDTRGPDPVKDNDKPTRKHSFTAGDDSGHVNVKWASTRTLVGSDSETHELSALLESVIGNSLAFGFTANRNGVRPLATSSSTNSRATVRPARGAERSPFATGIATFVTRAVTVSAAHRLAGAETSPLRRSVATGVTRL